MKRIDKRQARNLYKQGVEIAMTPHKMRVNNPWCTTFYKELDIVNPKEFDSIVNSIEYYNCNYETGYYLAYYIEQ